MSTAGILTALAADWRVLAACAIAFALLAAPVGAVTRYVDDNTGADGANSPYTNAASPAQTIQAAIDVSVSNDLILVAAGTYDAGTRVVDGTMKNRVVVDRPVTVRGVGSRDAVIIKGLGPLGDGAVRCVWLGPNARLEGLTLTNGYTRTAGDAYKEQTGGGVYIHQNIGAVVSNCVISGCVGWLAGGGAMRGVFYNCRLEGNTVAHSESDGGGAHSATLYDCVVRGNHARDEGGGLYTSHAYRCDIDGNECPEAGGMFGGWATASILRNNIGEFYAAIEQGVLRDCLVYGNRASGQGCAGFADLVNCTIVSNVAFHAGGLASARAYNCIIWGNTATGSTNANWYSSTISYSCTTPLPAGVGNTTKDPAFVDAPNGDYRLLTGSPCIGAGSNWYVRTSVDLDGNPRIVGARVDMGAYEHQTPLANHALTVVSAHGVADPAVGVHTNTEGTRVACRVSGIESAGTTQYVCTGWALAGQTDIGGMTSGATTNLTLVHTNDAVLAWQWRTQYWLNVEAEQGGTVTPASGWHDAGANVTVEATADPYWHVSHWTGDTGGCVLAGNVMTAAMTRARSIAADFAANLATNATPQWWLALHGWSNDFDVAALDDPDEDGMPTWAEFHADTIPTDGDSFLGITGIVGAVDGILVGWQGGSNAWQRLEVAQDLTATGAPWVVLFTNVPPTSPATHFLHAPATDGVRFYRLRAWRGSR